MSSENPVSLTTLDILKRTSQLWPHTPKVGVSLVNRNGVLTINGTLLSGDALGSDSKPTRSAILMLHMQWLSISKPAGDSVTKSSTPDNSSFTPFVL